MKRLLPALGILSVGLIAYQLVLMQVLALVQWYHFAYMIISVAMLGFGASGTFIALFRPFLLRHFDRVVPACMLISGASMALMVTLAESVIGGFDAYLLFTDRSEILPLVGTYLLYFFPFFTGATAIGLAFVRETERIGALYFSNLIGSGAGGVFALLLIARLPIEQLAPATAWMAIAAGMLLLPRQSGRWPRVIAVVAVVAVLTGHFSAQTPRLSQYKSLSHTLNLPEAEIRHERPSPHGVVHVVSSPALRYAPGLSLTFRGEIPVRSAVFTNGDWYGPIVGWSAEDTLHLFDYTTKALPFETGPRPRVLLLGAGTGADASYALSRGAEHISVVEPNRAVVSLLKTTLAPETDSLWHHPNIHVVQRDLRSALALTDGPYDVVILPDVGAFGGTGGVQAMQEQYHLTVEAFREIWHRLSPGGALSVTVWTDYPPRNPLKLLGTIVAMLEQEGIDEPRSFIAATRGWATITFLLSRSVITGDQQERIRSFSRRLQFDPLLLPDIEDEERARFNLLEDDALFDYVDRIMASDRQRLVAGYDFHLRPATDDRPYFSQFLRWRSLPHLASLFGQQAVPFLEVGYLLVAVTFVQIALLGLLLIVLPLVRLGWRGERRGWTLLYFSCLGLGFMFFEIVLIQRFVLYLGEPIYAAAAVIATLLIASGAGSFFSSRIPVSARAVRGAAAGVAVMLAAYAAMLSPLLDATMALPTPVKAVLSFAVLVPPGFLMGMPFPLGLRRLNRLVPESVPWAWGINGCLSVMSAALAVIVAVELGFTAVIVLAACAYLVAAIGTR